MHLNHLHLHVRDVDAAKRFYEGFFELREKVRYGDLLFVTDGAGFDLALMQDAEPEPLPRWFHFGFRLPSAAHVRGVLARMTGAGVTIRKPLHEDDDLVSFTCEDPDGCAIEVYWE